MRRSGLLVGYLGIARVWGLWLMCWISPWAVGVGGETRRGTTGGSVDDRTGGGATVDEGYTLMVYLSTEWGEGSAVDSVGSIAIIGSGGELFLRISG